MMKKRHDDRKAIEDSILKITDLEEDFIVSNTPRFLVKKLLINKSIEDFSKLLTPDDILAAVSEATSHRPSTLREAALPYALLVALHFTDSSTALNAASTVRAKYHDWFGDVVDILKNIDKPAYFVIDHSPVSFSQPRSSISGTLTHSTKLISNFQVPPPQAHPRLIVIPDDADDLRSRRKK